MVAPGVAILIGSALAAAAKGAGDYYSGQQSKKASARRSKETERETKASMLQDALKRSAELEAHRLGSRSKLAKSRTQQMQNTTDLIRGAFNI